MRNPYLVEYIDYLSGLNNSESCDFEVYVPAPPSRHGTLSESQVLEAYEKLKSGTLLTQLGRECPAHRKMISKYFKAYTLGG